MAGTPLRTPRSVHDTKTQKHQTTIPSDVFGDDRANEERTSRNTSHDELAGRSPHTVRTSS
eukprot:225479-Amphidinium_carterae.3